MKKHCILTAALLLGLCGCQSKPTEATGKEHFTKTVLAKYAGRASVIKFKQTKVGEGMWFGVKFLDMDFDYEFACNNSIQIRGLEAIPVENVEHMQTFFAKQTVPWDQIDFSKMPDPGVQLDGPTTETIFKAYGKKQSLILCRIGEKVEGSGRMRFLLRDNGWEAEK